MFAILGAAGKVGRATVSTLRAAGRPVRAILRDPSKAAAFEALGCEVATADLHDADALARAFDGAAFVQVICPPAPRAGDAGAEMGRSIESIAKALTAVRPQATLAISDYGAEIESGTGITVLFHELEVQLRALPTEAIFLRSAEHMENWARVIRIAADSGRLPSLHHPLSKRFPTVSAPDVGRISAEILMQRQSGAATAGLFHVEGPERYTPADVAKALTTLLNREVVAFEVPRQAWHQTMLSAGLSDSGAGLVTELYDAHNRGLIDVEDGAGQVFHGTTDLVSAFQALLGRK
ncbi:NmrA family transcriptional regulator [Labrys miyagiensis]|uniref:NmrA family transcriptional regulator n=1 Tax=Labrys miyagiensis TaxID=346912 RepID=A0ABQ6CI30_9HYPH|nr:NAD(P)H-binding protein [Labrys miyagiensis]GLS19297.1 NmrA family transcriptional regulator [Labrys miyagiensis]